MACDKGGVLSPRLFNAVLRNVGLETCHVRERFEFSLVTALAGLGFRLKPDKTVALTTEAQPQPNMVLHQVGGFSSTCVSLRQRVQFFWYGYGTKSSEGNQGIPRFVKHVT